jgi:concanavalin A-like lectin/glucanase superfamily protein
MRVLVVCCVLCAMGCSSRTGTPAPLQIASGTTAPAPPAATPQSSAGGETATATCPSDAPVLCESVCCPAGDTCQSGGGCSEGAQGAECPSTLPVACGTPPSCANGCTAVDASPNDNTLHIEAPAVLAQGKFGGGLSPAPSGAPAGGSWAQGNGIPAGDGAETIEMWIRGIPTSGTVDLHQRGGDRSLAIVDGRLQWNFCVTALPHDDAWHFIAVTYASGTLTVSVDGAAPRTCGTDPRATPANARTYIGSAYPGLIDEVRISTRALSASEIAADFQAGQLAVTADTAALWHFDEGSGFRCCAAGATCDPSGNCAAAPIEGAASQCPAEDPVDCHDGSCCPGGFTCGDGTCVVTSIPACPSGTSEDCGNGKCCPSGMVCDGGTWCVASQGQVTATTLCGNTYAFGTAALQIDATTGQCCPNTAQISLSSDQTCFPGAAYGCSTPQDHSQCPFDYHACSTYCAAAGYEATCPDGGVICGGNRCCPAGMACGDPISNLCCPAGQIACGNGFGTACCPEGGPVAQAGKACADGTSACGSECCPGGAVCNGGQCVPVEPVQAVCGNGLTCGDTCCPTNTRCASPGVCVTVPAPPGCPDGFSGACSGAGPCCRDGFVCMGASGGTGGYFCVGTGSARGGPQGPACGASSQYCASGDVCAGAECCPADHPLDCGSACCLPGASCANGACACPSNLPVLCGGNCCEAGAACEGGNCVKQCADGRDPCGTACCGQGIACVNGQCACPADHPDSCGNECCLQDGCSGGTCKCPAGRAACGDQCCGAGQACIGGACVSQGGDCNGDDYQAKCPGGGTMCCSIHMVCCSSGGRVQCQFQGFCD